MVQVKVNPNLTEEDVPALVAELEKLSSLNPVKDTLKAAGKSLEPRPAKDMLGSRPRENDVFMKDFVDGALELAQMLGIEDQGTHNPSKGLSFRASNYKFYDFMGYWSALIKRFSKNEERMTVFEKDVEDIELDNIYLVKNMRELFEYAKESRKRTDRKIETIQAQADDFEQAACLITEHVGDFAKKTKELDATIIALASENKKLKTKLFWLTVFAVIPCFYIYGTILSKIF